MSHVFEWTDTLWEFDLPSGETARLKVIGRLQGFQAQVWIGPDQTGAAYSRMRRNAF
jgi:hypothetical protein